jgi:hypothetical protein
MSFWFKKKRIDPGNPVKTRNPGRKTMVFIYKNCESVAKIMGGKTACRLLKRIHFRLNQLNDPHEAAHTMWLRNGILKTSCPKNNKKGNLFWHNSSRLMTTVATNCIYQLELEVEYLNIIVLLVKTTIGWIWFAFYLFIYYCCCLFFYFITDHLCCWNNLSTVWTQDHNDWSFQTHASLVSYSNQNSFRGFSAVWYFVPTTFLQYIYIYIY